MGNFEHGIACAFSSSMDIEIDPVRSSRPLAVVARAASGVGFELAKQFAEHGYDLLITDEDAKVIDAEKMLADFGGEVESLQLDIGSYDGVESLFRKMHRLGQPADAFVIHTKIDEDFARGLSLADELNMLELNVVSTVHLAKLMVAEMVVRGKGNILIGSVTPFIYPHPLDPVYVATKAFLDTFSEGLNTQLTGTGVNVFSLDAALDRQGRYDPAETASMWFSSLAA